MTKAEVREFGKNSLEFGENSLEFGENRLVSKKQGQ